MRCMLERRPCRTKWCRVRWGCALVVLVVAGCGGESVADPIDEGEIQVEMQEVDDSNVVGVRAVATYLDKNETRVLVDGAGPGEPSAGGPLSAAIVEGTCADPGTEAFDVGELSEGQVTQTLRIGLPALLAGDYAVQVTSADVGVLACGEFPDRMPR
jgi:hypothetical protein